MGFDMNLSIIICLPFNIVMQGDNHLLLPVPGMNPYIQTVDFWLMMSHLQYTGHIWDKQLNWLLKPII